MDFRVLKVAFFLILIGIAGYAATLSLATSEFYLSQGWLLLYASMVAAVILVLRIFDAVLPELVSPTNASKILDLTDVHMAL